MEFKYNYIGEETPEERLRNKLQPLFFLVEKIKAEGHCNDMPEVLEASVANLDEIRAHLSDINPFYKMKTIKELEYSQDNTSKES